MTVPAVPTSASRLAALMTLRDQIAPEATDQELALFAEVSAHLELDPFADQIVLIGRWDKRLGRKVHRHQVTVAGRRVIASRTGELAGIEGPVWCGPRAHADAPLQWLEVWDRDDYPYCARVLVHRRGSVTPYNGTAKWSEFSQTDNQGKLLPLWARMPSHMLAKVAESMALRRAFPEVITDETIGGAYVGPSAVDYAEVLEASERDAESVTPEWDIDRSADWPVTPPVEPADALEADAEAGPTPRVEGYPLTGGLVPDRDWWVERCRRADVLPARLMAEARRLAGELGVTPPRDGNEIRDPQLVAACLDWLEQMGERPIE